MKKFIHLSTVFLVSLLFSACGDDGSSSSANNVGTDFAFNVESSDDLPNCREKLEGIDAYVKADNTVRLCRSERWLVLGGIVANRDSLPNCASVREGDRAFLERERITLVCSDGKWTLFDVGDLEPESGSSGSAGSSSGEETSSSSAATVISSSSVEKSSSSSSGAASSSSVAESSSSSAIVVTEYLNQELLAAGKYGYLVDTRDSQVYRTIEIGEQTWMAQNLNFAYNQKTTNLDSSSFCYNNDPDSCAKYGRLYLWSAAMDSVAVFDDDGKGCGKGGTCENSDRVRGVCPAGWHLPDSSEFRILHSAVGDFRVVGKLLKSAVGWNGLDSFGFSALPAGYRFDYDDGLFDGYFFDVGANVDFWSASELDSECSSIMNLNNPSEGSELRSGNKASGLSVRCVKDSN